MSCPVRSWIQNSTTVESVTVTIKYQAGAIGLRVTCSSQVTKNCAKPPNTEMPSPYTTDMPVVRTALGKSSGSMVMTGAVCSANNIASKAITVISRALLGADTSHWKHGNSAATVAARAQKITRLRPTRSANRPTKGAATKPMAPSTTLADSVDVAGRPSSLLA